MKKILFMVMIILSSAVSIVLANTNEALIITSEEDIVIPLVKRYIIDNASLLTDEQILKLEATSADIKEKYNFDVVILTVSDILDKSPMVYSKDFYDDNNYHKNGIIFFISMADRDWDISTFNYGQTVFTDEYGLDYIVDKVVASLSDGDYDKSFSNFLYYADVFLLEAQSGTPYSVDNKIIPKNKIMIFIAIGAFIISILVIVVMIRSMNTKRQSNLAYNYVKRESINMTENEDIYLYRTVVKTAKPKESSSSSSGGGSSSRSGGRSGKF